MTISRTESVSVSEVNQMSRTPEPRLQRGEIPRDYIPSALARRINRRWLHMNELQLHMAAEPTPRNWVSCPQGTPS